MLRIAPLGDRTGRYYLASPDIELPSGVPSSAWAGRGSEGLGLNGRVEDDALGAILHGCHPGRGNQLVGRPSRVSSFDLTFAAPKSVSVLSGLAGEEDARTVVAAHREAVAGALSYLEDHAATVRQRSGEDRAVLPADGLVAASFVHATSRSLDPHLHSHVVVANLAHGSDGRWRALDSRALYAHRRAAGEIYRGALRAELSERCGIGWERRRNGTWEVSGIDPAMLGTFSGRAAEVRARRFELGDAGGRSGRSASVGRATREEKTALARRELVDRWRRTAAREGFDRTGLEAMRGCVAQPPGTVDEHRFAGALHEEATHSVVRRTAVAAWADALAAGSPAAEIDRCVDLMTAWGDERGVAEARRAPAEVVPPGHLLRALGPRPTTASELGLWQGAAREVTAYRTRWGVHDREEALGAAGGGAALAAFGSQRLAEHLDLTRRLHELERRLGRSAARSLEERGMGRER